MSNIFNRAMLQLARNARGVTQGELAKNAGVTQALISKLENGLTVDPTDETVDALAKTLCVPTAFFYSDEKPHGLPPFHYRKRAKLGAKALNKIEADINIRRMHLARLLQSYELPNHRDFPVIDLAKEQWTPRDAAQHIRGHWVLPRGPVENLTEIAEGAGVVIVQIDFNTPHLDALSFRLPGLPPLIFMNKAVPGDRYRFTLAHELGHLLLHHDPEAEDEMEAQADEFAAELLMPAKEIKPYLAYPNLSKLARAKPYWKVSIKALIVQASRLKMITPNQYRGLNVQYSKAGYGRHGEPHPIPIEKPAHLSEAIRHHMEDLNYTVDEMSYLLMLEPGEFLETYTDRPRLRVVR